MTDQLPFGIDDHYAAQSGYPNVALLVDFESVGIAFAQFGVGLRLHWMGALFESNTKSPLGPEPWDQF